MKNNIITFEHNLNIPKSGTLKLPSISDFENFTKAVLCSKKTELHCSHYLKLNSTFNTAEELIFKCVELLEPRLSKNNVVYSLPMIDSIVMDYGLNKITRPSTVSKIPECLVKNTNSGDNGYKDNLVSQTEDVFVDVDSKDLDEIDRLKTEFKEDITSSANEAIKSIKKIIMSFLKEEDRLLFELFDKFNNFIRKTEFIQTYKEFKDVDRCIRKNCTVLSEYLYTDDFLFYDLEKKNFILPISINNNKFIIKRIFEKDYLSPEQMKQCDNIQKIYSNYLVTLKELAKLNASKITDVKDEVNPFSKIVKDMSFEKTNTVNTLF